MSEEDTLGRKNQGDRRVWENPDPRIKWALDIFDHSQIPEAQQFMDKWTYWVTIGAAGAWGFVQNMRRRPLYANIIPGALFVGATYLLCTSAWHIRRERAEQRAAAAMHYIMLHPDRFPEPEYKKFGDKEVFLCWNPRFFR